MGKGQQQQLITTKLESVEGLHFNSAIQMCNVDFFTHFSINNSLFSKILDAKNSLGTAMVFCYHNCSNVLWEKIVGINQD